MGYAGNPDLWADLFPDDLIPAIIDLVLQSWKAFRKPAPTEHEVPITKRFCACLRQHKTRNRLPFAILPESEELEPESGELLGRIDLRLLHGHHEEVYFAIECKRLNVVTNSKRSSLARDYVEKGMMRFITGKYAKGLDKGGMLGYVMDGKVAGAIASVKQAIDSRSSLLALDKGTSLCVCTLRPTDKQVKETKHIPSGNSFVIYHVFVGV